MLKTVHKKIFYDTKGNPSEVILPWKEYKEIAELLGLDLDSSAKNDLRQARKDRASGNMDAYQKLSSI